MEEINSNYNEFNIECNEHNSYTLVNESNIQGVLEDNSVSKHTLDRKTVNSNLNKKKSISILAKFVFLCVAVVIMPIGVYIPVFSEILYPSSSPIITAVPTYNFTSVVPEEDKINFSFTIDDADLKDSNYYLYLIEQDNASEEFLESVDDSYKLSAQIKINYNAMSYSFTSYLSSSGIKSVLPDTDYAILVVKDNVIVQKELVKTKKLVYIQNVDLTKFSDATYKYLKFQVKENEKFTDFDSLYFEIYNLTLDKVVTDFSRIDKAYLSESWALIPVASISDPEYEYELHVFCSTDHPDKIKYTKSFVKDEITYYLIYIYENTITY